MCQNSSTQEPNLLGCSCESSIYSSENKNRNEYAYYLLVATRLSRMPKLQTLAEAQALRVTLLFRTYPRGLPVQSVSPPMHKNKSSPSSSDKIKPGITGNDKSTNNKLQTIIYGINL